MHELSLAQEILDITLSYAGRHEAKNVTAVGLILGEDDFLEMESLRFCFEAISRNTVAQGAKLLTRKVPGRELKVEYLEVD